MKELKWKKSEVMRCGCWEMKYGLRDLTVVSKLYNIPRRTLGRYMKMYETGDKKYEILLFQNNPPNIILKYRKTNLELERDMKRRLNLGLAKCTGILEKKNLK